MILQLGCGTALPSLAVLQWYLQRPASCDSSLDLGLADYNPTVLQLVTLPNVILSWAQVTKSDSWEAEGELDIDEALISEFISSLKSHDIKLSFFSGAWSPEFVSLVCKEMEQPYEKMTIVGAE